MTKNLRSFQTIGTMNTRWQEFQLKTVQKLATIVHWHGIGSWVLFWMAVLSLLILFYEPCLQHETCFFFAFLIFFRQQSMYFVGFSV